MGKTGGRVLKALSLKGGGTGARKVGGEPVIVALPAALAHLADVPRPPDSGTFVLTSTDGVLSWESAE